MFIPSKKLLPISLLIAAIAVPLLAQAAFSLPSLPSLSTPIGGKVLTVIPNPPPTPATPNPCYNFRPSYLITLGPPSAGEYILNSDVKVINGTNPPTVGVWALGLASRGLSACKEIDKLLGVSGIL
jgi:hypothetical protein